jgi:hypothetical protein
VKRYLGRAESKKVRSKVNAIFGGTAMERFLKDGGKDVTMQELGEEAKGQSTGGD